MLTSSIVSLRIVELGPGRGTLLSDALRTIGQIVPKIRDVLHVDLVEMSPKLQKVQERALESAKQAGVTFKWHTHIDTVEKPDGVRESSPRGDHSAQSKSDGDSLMTAT